MKTSSAKAKPRWKGCYRQAKTADEYLNARLDKSGDCWLWVKGKDKDGYGQCHDSKCAKEAKVTRAHQLAYTAWVGVIPKGKIVCHTCDTPACCNPAHLYAGTWQSNVDDCVNRGRYANGSKPRKCKYRDVMAYKDRGMSCFEVAKIFNISFSRVCQIWRGEFSNANF